MNNPSKFWLTVRIFALAVGFLSSGPFLHALTGDFSRPSLLFALSVVGLSAFGVVFVWMGQVLNPWSSLPWLEPTWSTPLGMFEPLLTFHLAGWSSISLGTGCILLALLGNPATWAWELPVSAGIGVLLGVRFVCLAQRPRSGA